MATFHAEKMHMLTLYYAPGACSLAAHIVLEESGEQYEARKVDLSKGEQKTPEYLKIHPLGRVPALLLDSGEPLTENTAILPYLGKRFKLWPTEPVAEAKALSAVGFFAASVHPAHAHIGRPERYSADKSALPGIQDMGKKTFHGYLEQIDQMYAGREWLSDKYSVLDAYALVFYAWGLKRELPVAQMKNYSALKDRMAKRPAVKKVLEQEGVKV
jgi:glutathione S-transferase